MFGEFITSLFGEQFWRVLQILFVFYPIWLPLILIVIFYNLWIRYVRTKFIVSQGSYLLEFKLPSEIDKSPLAMEIILTSLYQTAAASYLETYIDGKTRPTFSLEIVSIEGEIHFYMWTHRKFKGIIEAQVYSQYPGVEVYEVPDYATRFKYNPDKHGLWGTYFKLEKHQAYPLKTYADYELDKNPKEEHKIDPLTSTLEYYGALGKGQQGWFQILFRAHKKVGIKEGEPTLKGFGKKFIGFFMGENKFSDLYHFEGVDWRKEAQEELKAYRVKTLGNPNNPDAPLRLPSKGEADVLSAMERKLTKYPFETMMRGFYISEQDHFDAANITGLIGSVRQYNSRELNGLRLGWFTDHEDNWKDFFRYFLKKLGKYIRLRMEENMLRAYKLRSFFDYPYRFWHERPYILTTDELATMYHFPGKVAGTPTLTRVPSKKAEAPSNLPT
jgi:hypothetical protein